MLIVKLMEWYGDGAVSELVTPFEPVPVKDVDGKPGTMVEGVSSTPGTVEVVSNWFSSYFAAASDVPSHALKNQMQMVIHSTILDRETHHRKLNHPRRRTSPHLRCRD